MNRKEWWAERRAEVADRAGHRCEKCSDTVNLTVHHRKLKSRGGSDNMVNLVLLCMICHRWVHDNPAEASRLGYMVHSWEDE